MPSAQGSGATWPLRRALQLQWRSVDLRRGTVFFEKTRNGVARTVALHPIVKAGLKRLWRERQRPKEGHVFLNIHGRPCADTRTYSSPGGNPLAKAHKTALRRAQVRPNGGPDFTVHDWRHHWASWMVMVGNNLETIRKMGGWADIEMVKRYAAIDVEHMAEAVAKLR